MTAKNEVSTGDHKLLRELKNAASTQVCNSNKEGLKMVSHFEDQDTFHRCDFAAHLDYAISWGNMEDINLLELKEEEFTELKAMLKNVDSKLDQSVDLEICKKCSIYGSEIYQVFRCTTCDFVLDFKCVTAWYYQHEHPFTLCYAPEDDSGEYYYDICEEERDPKQWFYYCEDCSYPAHPKCILGEYPNLKRNIYSRLFKAAAP
ncbi:hypothetical protein SO802_025775 [Lithocarpus litseifolius]|uniref:DC1 domain-containing protein n=1 Tax=Lithocarpus litseifolius TaxID=425828 RepID=A0AAW2C151_9ROSI